MGGAGIIDLFCGAGGLSEGFRQAGFSVLAGTDNDPDACATYASNFPEARLACGDLADDAVREEILEAGQDARVVVGGPPCQAFSQVRNHDRLIDDPRNALYREFVRVVATLLPDAFVMENVPGLEQVGLKGQILADLSLDGEYTVNAQVVEAADFGVPQTRKRIVFLGLRKALGCGAPKIAGSGARNALALARLNGSLPIQYRVARNAGVASWAERLRDPEDVTAVTASQALSDLTFLRPGRREDEVSETELPSPRSAYQRLMRAGLDGCLANTSVPRINADTVLRLKSIPKGGNYRDLPEALRERYITGARWGPDAGNGTLSRRHYYAYRRLHPNFWSWTLNTKADSVYHYGSARALSVREFARLQSFPDRFRFVTDPRKGNLPGRIEGGAAHSRYRQVGNAVPPLLARAVAEALREALG